MSELSDKIETLEKMNESFLEVLKDLYKKSIGGEINLRWFSLNDIPEEVKDSYFMIEGSSPLNNYAMVYPFKKIVIIDKFREDEKGYDKGIAQKVEKGFKKLGYKTKVYEKDRWK
jgi:hypothetical protein